MTAQRQGVFQQGSIRLHYTEAGFEHGASARPLMLFCHGFPSCGRSFRLQFEAFANDYHVVAVDALGANQSSKPDTLEPYRIDQLASQLDGLARHVAGDGSFVLVGHDWGGALAWSFAQAWPDRLDAVIVMNAPPYNILLDLLRDSAAQRERSSYMYSMRRGKHHQAMTRDNGLAVWQRAYEPLRALPQFTAADDEYIRQALTTPGAIDGGINWYRANIPEPDQIADADYWPARGTRLRVPGLLFWGEDDGTFEPEFIDRLAAQSDLLQVEHLPQVGHWSMLQRPEQVNTAMREFLMRSTSR